MNITVKKSFMYAFMCLILSIDIQGSLDEKTKADSPVKLDAENSENKNLTQQFISAINVATSKWTKEIDQDIELDDKIKILQQWAAMLQRHRPLTSLENLETFNKALENVKKDYQREYLFEEMSEEEEQSIDKSIEELELMLKQIKLITSPLGSVMLSAEENFAQRWINSKDQKQKNETFRDLVHAVIEDFDFSENRQQAERNFYSLYRAIDELENLISPDTRANAIQLGLSTLRDKENDRLRAKMLNEGATPKKPVARKLSF